MQIIDNQQINFGKFQFAASFSALFLHSFLKFIVSSKFWLKEFTTKIIFKTHI
jgi:hypothetical protein